MASATVRAIGPAVSWTGLIGTMPAPGMLPTVGLKPTTPHTPAGETIEPSVSVPTASGARPAATAAAEPDEEPEVLRSRSCGLRVWPPTALQPLVEAVERKFAHSDRLVAPSTTRPAARSRATSGASAAGGESSSAREPAVPGSPTRLDVVLDQHRHPVQRAEQLRRRRRRASLAWPPASASGAVGEHRVQPRGSAVRSGPGNART